MVFTGGARSGKSSAAQRLAEQRAVATPVTVVVFGRPGIDAEFAERIALHRSARPDSWNTLEAGDSTSWMNDLPDTDVVVVDCLGTLLGLAMEELYGEGSGSALGEAHADRLPEGFETAVNDRFGLSLRWFLERSGDTIVVTNEVGDGIVPAYATGRLFRDTLGRANRVLVGRSDAAYLCVAGRLIDLLGLPEQARWPQD